MKRMQEWIMKDSLQMCIEGSVIQCFGAIGEGRESVRKLATLNNAHATLKYIQ